jgi:heme exporter protein C
VISGVNVPIVYQSVKWWRSLHQVQSEMMGKSTIDPAMRGILYFNVFAFLFVTVWFMARRYRIAEARAESELPEPLPELPPRMVTP